MKFSWKFTHTQAIQDADESDQLTSCEDLWSLNCPFWTKYQSIVYINASSNENHPLLFSHIKIHQHICFELFWTAYFSPDSNKMPFSLEKWFEVKNVLMIL